MNTQPSLFDTQPPPARSRRSDPPTSKSAARCVRATYLEGAVLEVLRLNPRGLTSHEVSAWLDLPLVTVSPRFRPLVNKNLIIDSGEKRAGVGFKTSIVWKVR